jgi:hypothetical protein
MDFSKLSYSPQLLRDAIEIELQKTFDSKQASITAIKRLQSDPEYYFKNFGLVELNKAIGPRPGHKYINRKSDGKGGMTKASGSPRPGHKYIKRVPKKSGKGWDYFYFDPKGHQQSKASWIDIIANLFGFKESKEVNKKIAEDYKEQQLDKKFNLTWDGWKQHIDEYFKNQAKWQLVFSGKKETAEKKPSDGKKKKKTTPSTGNEVKKSTFKIGVMKIINELYGGSIQNNKQKQKGTEKAPNNFESMPEKQPEQKKEESEIKNKKDIKIAKIITEVTPETRLEKEREIMGAEPVNEENISIPIVDFKPIESKITIPFYKGGNPSEVSALDYTAVASKDIYLISEKKIMDTIKPSYIPVVDENWFKYNGNILLFVKLEENKYLIQTSREHIRGTSQEIQGENNYAIVTRDVLAATQDYWLKIIKEKRKEEINKRIEKIKSESPGRYDDEYLRKRMKSRVMVMPENKMSYAQQNFMNDFNEKKINYSLSMWNEYKKLREDLRQKTEDMEIQLEEFYNAHAKGEETSYGDKGTKNDLLEKYGVKVKRQNGAEIKKEEIKEIKNAIDLVYEIFGDRSSMAKNFGLKISHAGTKMMHARKACGLFFPYYHAIGITESGEKGTGFILSHEWGHFMDYYMGNKSKRHYISDDPNHIAGKIAYLFRKNMEKPQKSKYQNRTAECFARAMEQYWAIKSGNDDILKQWNDKKNHPSDEIFKEKIMPLMEQFFKENEQMLKAFFKKFNPKTNQFEYKKI